MESTLTYVCTLDGAQDRQPLVFPLISHSDAAAKQRARELLLKNPEFGWAEVTPGNTRKGFVVGRD